MTIVQFTVSLKFKVGELNVDLEDEASKRVPCYKKANDGEKHLFKETLDQHLINLNVPDRCVNCVNVKCQDHKEELESYCIDVCQTIEDVAKTTLPLSGGKGPGKERELPGWNEYVKPH